MASEFEPRPAPPHQVAPAETPTPANLVTLAGAVVGLVALYVGRDVFLPIVLAVLLAFVLAPFVDLLRRWYLGRALSVAVAVILALAILSALAGVTGLQLAQFAGDLPRYRSTIAEKVTSIRAGTLDRIAGLLTRFNREVEQATQTPPSSPAAPTALPEAPKPLTVEVRQPETRPIELAGRLASVALYPLTMVGITFVVVIFILLQREDLRDRMIRLFGTRDLHRTTMAMDEAAERLSRFYLIQLALNAGFGVFIAAALALIGMPNPVLFGIVAALSRFVPYIGGFLAAAVPIAVAAAVDPGWSMALWTLALFVVAEPVMGHLIEPLAFGRSTGLSPIAVVVAAIFWTWLWGPIGLLISTPLTLCLVVLGRHVDRLEFLDVLLGDRPALSPPENFYQRMLAGDVDEALEQAEQLLKKRSLSSYYDDVAIKGLELAANDVARGALRPTEVLQIRDAVNALVDDLSLFPDVDPPLAGSNKAAEDGPDASLAEKTLPQKVAPAPLDSADVAEPWRGEAAIMCIAGRSPLDEPAASMLAQLLAKHGLGARVVPHAAISRSNIIGLDTTGVAMVCVLNVGLTGSPPHLRYLVRRLRLKVKQAPILVGILPTDDPGLTRKELRDEIDAQYCVASLNEAVDATIRAARDAATRKAEESPVETIAAK